MSDPDQLEPERILEGVLADAILSVKTAEAAGIQKVLDAKAEGYRALVESAMKDPKYVDTYLICTA